MDTAGHLESALVDRYQIRREIGKGGMATVFLAHDVKHDRLVALKVLDPELGAVLGADRFLAEIKVTAHLQHPNLLPLFDSGEAAGLLYYVMPYVEGETLRQRLAREKQLPVDTALHLATTIAGAVDYAHRHGVIHRDLKPENILLHEGQALVADFGIALAVSNAGGSRITQTGLSLGTPQYMSPEQATGDRVIDGRTDIYSLAAVLYEMLTGDPPHLASTAQAVISKVLTERPASVHVSRTSVPAHVSAAVDRALEKLPADRFATARDFADALREPRALGETHMPRERVASASSGRVLLGVLIAVAIAASGLAAWGWLRALPQASPLLARFVITLPDGMGLDNTYVPPTVSRDGRIVVVRAQIGSALTLVRRRLDDLEPRRLAGTDGAMLPAISPDNQWVSFVSNGRLLKMPIDGGEPTPIANISQLPRGVDWSPSGALVLGSRNRPEGMTVVSASGGELTPLTTLEANEDAHAWPRVLADSNTVVYISRRKQSTSGTLATTTLRSGGKDARVLDVAAATPIGMVGGHLFYVTFDGSLKAVPFDLRTRSVTGPPIALSEQVSVNRSVGRARAGLSDSGMLVYVPGRADLVTRSAVGDERSLFTGIFDMPRWSPDGGRIAVAVSGPRGTDVSLFSTASGVLTSLTTDGASTNPTWAAGDRVVYLSTRSGRQAIWWQDARGVEPAVKLFEATGNSIVEALVTADARTIVYRTLPQYDIYTVAVGGGTPTRLGDFGGANLALSSDDKLLAYINSEQQLVVRPFRGPGGAKQITRDAASDPMWSQDGKHLYYRQGLQVMAVDITNGSEIGVGAPRVLFDGEYFGLGGGGPVNMTLSRDGRFAMLRQQRLSVTTDVTVDLRRQIGAKSR
jgi:serine/threonine-protein kinase